MVAKSPESLLAPEVEDNKYSIPKTWISEKQILKILQKTPADHVFTRPAKGGGTWDYVTGAYVEKVLNYVFGWLWDFEIVSQEVVAKQVITLGRLTVKDGKGNSIVKMQNGRADIKYRKGSEEPLDLGNDYKASATDCLKKCASKFGIASDIYGKNEFREIRQTTEPIKQVKPVQNNAPRERLFTVARKYGAENGAEAGFISNALNRDIDFDALTDKEVLILMTEISMKLTPRQ